MINFMASKPNALGKLGAVALHSIDTGEETYLGNCCGPSLAGTSGKKSVSFRRLGVEESPLIASISLSINCNSHVHSEVPKIHGNRD